MAGTEPRDWAPGETVTAALMDSEISDQFKETAWYKATAKGEIFSPTQAKEIAALTPGIGQLIYDSGEANGLRWSEWVEAEVLTSEATSSTSYTDLATPGPEITVDVGSSGEAEIWWEFATAGAADAEARGNVRVGANDPGATTPSNDYKVKAENGLTTQHMLRAIFTGLTPGNNTFKMRYRTDGSSVNFAGRKIRGRSR